MYTFEIPTELNHGAVSRSQTLRVCHTFRQIAAILAERNGEAICPAHVERICHAAEAKFVSALLADLTACSRPCFDQPADHSLRLRGSRNGFTNTLRSN